MSETSKKFEIHKNIVDLDKYPLKWQIEQLTYAIENFHKFKEKNCWGLCAYIDSNCKDEYHSGSISSKLTLFNRENAQNFNEKFKARRSNTSLWWWDAGESEPRIKFLEWMLTETKKLDHGTK